MNGDSIGFWLIALPAFGLALVSLTAAARWLERRSPRVSRLLDRHIGKEPEWLR